MKTTIRYGRIYGRFSSKPQERGDSKRQQIEGAKEYAKDNRIEIIGEPYFDEAVSGKAGANLEKEFGRLLKEAQPGEIILCHLMDRLGRQNPFILGKLIYDLTQRGLTLIAWGEGKEISKDNIDTLETQFSVFTGAAVGHADNTRKMKRLRETTKNAFEEGEEDGKQSGTLVKYLPQCFTWNEQTKTIGYDEDKAKVIRRIFDMFTAGTGKTTICQTLNAEGVPTPYKAGKQTIGKKKLWLETSIKKILLNESYAGVLRVKGHKITCIPVIVHHDIFDKAQVLLQRFAKRSGNVSSGRVNNVFNGLAVCKHCWGTVNVSVSPPKKEGNKTCYSFRCKNAHMKQCECHKMLNADAAELSFFSVYFGGSPEHALASNSKDITIKVEAVETRIKKLNASIANLYDMAEEGDTEAKDRIAKRRIEKAEAEQELILLKGQVVERDNLPSMYDELQTLVGNQKQLGYDAFFPMLKEKLSDNDTRLRLRTLLPSIFSKVVFDLSGRTIEGVLQKGVSLPNAMKLGKIIIPPGVPKTTL